MFSSVVLGFSSEILAFVPCVSALGIGQSTKVDGFQYHSLRLDFTSHIQCMSSEAFCFDSGVLDLGSDIRVVEQSGGL